MVGGFFLFLGLIKMTLNRNFLSRNHSLLLLLCLVFLLGACGPAEENANNENNPVVTRDGYPGANETATAYPSPVVYTGGDRDSSYPPPLATDKPLFEFDLPLKAGDTTVSGQSPESLPLAIVDITYNGLILGTGQSGDDGRFSITVSALTEGNRIGITVTELEDMTYEEMVNTYFNYRGEGFMNLPNVGIFYDTAIVEP